MLFCWSLEVLQSKFFGGFRGSSGPSARLILLVACPGALPQTTRTRTFGPLRMTEYTPLLDDRVKTRMEEE
jgi:hypothetical protein